MCQRSNYGFGGHPEYCGCGHPGHHGMGEQRHHEGCCHHGFGLRRFPTREEMIAEMEEYLKQLQAETKGVEEHLAELKKSQA